MQKNVEYNYLIFSWIKWHYFLETREIFLKWKSFLVFTINYFSIPLLLRTYLHPWRKYKWSYGRGFYLERYFEVMVANGFSRVIGAFIRTFVILFGVIFLLFVIIFGVLIILFWTTMPFLIIATLLWLILN